ncbi:hypothetical protein GCM10022224_063560 [Nonomuraea antimicrobica]|uniref:Uncharacterized protein n=1 Tax=Nonomuraea antimicrobica TaxID=561173 RepID=A0ABP7CI95_9ACTN
MHLPTGTSPLRLSLLARLTIAAAAGGLALGALTAPASAHIPSGIDSTVGVLNNAKLCVPGLEAAGVGVKVPIASPQNASCVQR